MSKSEFQRLPDVDPAVCALSFIPEYGQPDKIGINLGRLAAIAAWGGMQSEVRIVSEEGEGTSYSVGMTGVGPDGSAFAAGIGTAARAKTAQHERMPEGRNIKDIGIPKLTITLNSTEIAGRAESRRGGVRSPQSWAVPIDRAIRTQTVRAAWGHMAGKRIRKPCRTDLVSAFGYCMVSQYDTASTGHWAEWALSVLYGGMAITGASANAVPQVRRGHSLRESHISLVPGAHLDRAMLASAIALRPVVRALK